MLGEIRYQELQTMRGKCGLLGSQTPVLCESVSRGVDIDTTQQHRGI